jgi:branched-chain amino acid transport system substrate-binding protein
VTTTIPSRSTFPSSWRRFRRSWQGCESREPRTALIFSTSLVGLLAFLATTGDAQQPLRIGASLSQTGSFAALGQNQLRGYQLCVKHANEKGGVLGRRIELLVEDDQSKAPTAVAIYEKLITQDKMDAILGPYSSPITEAVADVNEKHRMPMVAPLAATTSIFKKGRKFIFMVLPPAEVYLEALVDMAAARGLKTLALINEDTIFPKATAQGTLELAKKRGLQVVFSKAYPKGTTDFSAILARVRAANPDVLATPTYFDDAVAITRQMKALNVNPKMYGVTVGGDLPKFHEVLGRDAEFVYGATPWDPELVTLRAGGLIPELVTLRAGGLIPVARQYPGAREFVEAHKKEFPGAGLSYHSAAGYAGCQIFLEAVKRAGSSESEKVREVILKIDLHTVFGAFKVDRDGFQIAHKMLMFQWQDAKKVILWPEELAPGKPRFPTPPWSQR